jgi:rhodanese-related sulfurtransferase
MKGRMKVMLVAAGLVAAQMVWADGRVQPAPSGAACPAGVCMPAPMAAKPMPAEEVATINTEGLAALIRLKTPMTLLDARTGKFDDGRRVPGAKVLAPTAKDEEVAAMLPDKQALIVTYCVNVKCQASPMLAKKLRGLGYTNVIEYHEGIEGWAAAGKPVEQAAK